MPVVAGPRAVVNSGITSATARRLRVRIAASGSGPLVPAIVQSQLARFNEGQTITLPNPTTVGNTVLIVVNSSSGGGQSGILTVTCPGFVFVSDFFTVDSGIGGMSGLAHAFDVPASSSPITVSWTGGATGTDCLAIEVTNLASVDVVGSEVTGGPTSTPPVPVLTPTVPGDLAVVVGNLNSQPTAGPAGWTNTLMDSPNSYEWASTIVIPGTSPPIGNWSGGSSDTYMAQGALFKAAT